MKLSASQAAKATGKSIPTITRAIRKGRISAERTEDGGGFLIDPAELFRVFPAATDERGDKPNELGVETPEKAIRYAKLEVELEALKERFRDMEGQRDDLRDERDRWRDMAERQQRHAENQQKQIEDMRTAAEKLPSERPKGLAGWFMRKSA